MAREKSVRKKWLTIRLNEDEEKKLNRFFEKTVYSSLSEYARNVLLQEPVTVFYRNQTADDFLAEMILLKRELNAIGHNFNQAVKRLHTLDHIPEILRWVSANEPASRIFLQKFEEITNKLHQIHRQWSQK